MIKKVTISPANKKAINAINAIREAKQRLQRIMAENKPLSSLNIKPNKVGE